MDPKSPNPAGNHQSLAEPVEALVGAALDISDLELLPELANSVLQRFRNSGSGGGLAGVESCGDDGAVGAAGRGGGGQERAGEKRRESWRF